MSMTANSGHIFYETYLQMKKNRLIFLLCILGNLDAQVKIGDNPTTLQTSSILELETISTRG